MNAGEDKATTEPPWKARGCDRYGASMGRGWGKLEDLLDPAEGEILLWQVPIDEGGYDEGGAYWGIGEPLWCAQSKVTARVRYFRAKDRKSAMTRLPGVRFA